MNYDLIVVSFLQKNSKGKEIKVVNLEGFATYEQARQYVIDNYPSACYIKDVSDLKMSEFHKRIANRLAAIRNS